MERKTKRRTIKAYRVALDRVVRGGRIDIAEWIKIRPALMISWSKLVPPKLIDLVEPLKIQKGVLYLRTENSNYSHYLSMHKGYIVRTVNKVIREIGITVKDDYIFDVNFETGQILNPHSQASKSRGIKKCTPKTIDTNSIAKSTASVIQDPILRAKFESYQSRRLANKAKKGNGALPGGGF